MTSTKPSVLSCHLVGDSTGAIGRVVVDDHQAVAMQENRRRQVGEVQGLVVGGDNNDDLIRTHSPGRSSCVGWRAG